jgi:proline dehydrogenase
MGLLLRLARQWIAGENAEDGVERIRDANSKGMQGLLNLLGEHVESKDEVEKTVSEYSRLLDLIQNGKVNSQISIKPTQFGLNIDPEYCYQNYLKLADLCKSHSNNWLWIDMEDSSYTQKTIDLYRKVLSKYENTGVAIQAYLKRTRQDLETLIPLSSKIRLVKGAYNEPPEVAFKTKSQVSENYSSMLELLFSRSSKDGFVAVATHDSNLIQRTKALAKQYADTPYEYEMLMGVRDNLKRELVAEGNPVREYVPYGPSWLPYSIRRLREKKSNIFLIARSVFG